MLEGAAAGHWFEPQRRSVPTLKKLLGDVVFAPMAGPLRMPAHAELMVFFVALLPVAELPHVSSK